MLEILFFLVTVLTVLSWGLSTAHAEVQDVFAATTEQEVVEYEELDTVADGSAADQRNP